MTGVNPNFNISLPTGPGPFMSYESDEESFVVLGKSLVNDVDYNSTENDAHDGNTTIEEAKKIIDEEIRSINSKVGSSINGEQSIKKTELTSVTPEGNPFQELSGSVFETPISEVLAAEKKSSVFSQLDNSLKHLSISEKQSVTNKTSVIEEKIEVSVIPSTSKQMPRIEQVQTKQNASIPSILWPQAQSGLLSATADKTQAIVTMPMEDLQKKIVEIIEENKQLKLIVEQNSVTMQEQCRRLSEWQDEVKKVHDAHKMKLLEAKQHIDKLNHEKNEGKDKIVGLQEELNMARTKLAEIQIVQTEVHQSRSAAYVQINSLNAEIQRLHQVIEELQKKTNNADEIYALETQLEIYKADFEAERRAKESIKEEKEKLIEDLQSLQRRNQQLQERIEMISDKDFVMFERTDRESRGRQDRSSSQVLPCPKCSSVFPDISALENHCFICIK